ncbi:MAG: extracellular solute-binding protein [Treponema sp.]|jgi:ABC-type glycerol-3-phosphate transport system substrate-binding protein|nr:extracellular solute-binding protein [Treponema sp.]
MKKLMSLLLVFAIIGLVSCSKKDSGSAASKAAEPISLKVTYLGTGENKDLLDKGLAIFTGDTGIKAEVVYVQGSWAEYFTKIQTMIAGGESIDASCVAIEGFEMLVKTGMAMPVDDWISRHKAEYDAIANDIDPMVLDFMKFDGKMYGLPNEWNNVVTHFNTELLADAGLGLPPPNWTKEQFLEYAQKLTKKRADGTTQYGCFVPAYYFGFEAWCFNNDTAFMTDDFKKSLLLDPKTVEMFQFMYDLIYRYQVAPIPEPGLDYINMMIQGDVAMMWAGRWPTNNYVHNEFKNAAVQYIPNFKTNATIWGGTGTFTLKTSKHPDEATALTVFLASRPWIETVMQFGAIPVLNSVARDMVTSLGVPDNAELYFNPAPVIRAVHSPSQYAECANLVERAINDILINKADIMATLRAADVELNSILADN